MCKVNTHYIFMNGESGRPMKSFTYVKIRGSNREIFRIFMTGKSWENLDGTG